MDPKIFDAGIHDSVVYNWLYKLRNEKITTEEFYVGVITGLVESVKHYRALAVEQAMNPSQNAFILRVLEHDKEKLIEPIAHKLYELDLGIYDAYTDWQRESKILRELYMKQANEIFKIFKNRFSDKAVQDG